MAKELEMFHKTKQNKFIIIFTQHITNMVMEQPFHAAASLFLPELYTNRVLKSYYLGGQVKNLTFLTFPMQN